MKKSIAAVAAASLLFVSGFGISLAASPTIAVSGGNTPFSTIAVSGSGFSPGENVQVMLGLNSATVAADGTGAFVGASLTIPNFSPGLYPVIAVGQTSGTVAFAYLYVQSLYPLASPSSWWLTPGSTLTWSGSGFVPNENISIALGTSTIATFTADAGGAFSGAGSSTVPFSLRNSTATYTLTSAQSHVSIVYHIGVADLYPYVNPSVWYALPGTHLNFSGAGFGGGEGVSIFVGASTTPIAHIATDASGAFSAQGDVTLPFLTPSPVSYRLVGDQSGAVALAPITLAQFYPTLNPSSYYAAPGSFITLGGSGFAPNEAVDVTIGSTTTAVSADAGGAFTGLSVHLPLTPNTMLSVSATGQTSGAHTSFVMAIGSYYSWITVDNYWAQGGTPLTVFGHNFAAGENITITSGAQTLGTATADSTGAFTASVAVPFQPSGPATILATGAQSGATGSATMTVAPVYTDLQMKNYFGAPGDPLEFIGHDYLLNEPIVLTTDRTGSSTVASWSADGTGSFDDSSFHIPGDFAAGNLVLTVMGLHSFDSKSITIYVTGH